MDTEETDDPDLEGVANFRPRCGYGPLLDAMARELIAKGKLRLNTRARRIEWRPGRVTVEVTDAAGGTRTFHAKKLVCTLPLGVLKNGTDLVWSPAPSELSRRWRHLEVGHVQKLVFRMRERFWENLGADLPVSFVHLGPEFNFPTWWTQHPRRTPLLVAWQGGPRAEAMSAWSETELVDAAVTTLTAWSKLSKVELRERIISVHHHDWSRDEFARGAYSYVGVGGQQGAKAFGKPLAETIFFAGEATQTGSARGTMHGAFMSGQRVARLIRA